MIPLNDCLSGLSLRLLAAKLFQQQKEHQATASVQWTIILLRDEYAFFCPLSPIASMIQLGLGRPTAKKKRANLQLGSNS
jgi:hypothetical protein